MQIVPNVHLVPGVIANAYLIVEPAGLTLIDAGLPGSQKKIFACMADLGFKPGDLKNIIITHSDFDHVGALAALKKASGAQVHASEIEARAISSGGPSRQIRPQNSLQRLLMGMITPFARLTPLQVDDILIDGQVLPQLGGLIVVDSSGHTPGHISLYSASVGILFCGDSIIAEKEQLLPSRPAVTWNREKADKAVRKQAELGAQIVCSGHGPVVMEAKDRFPRV